MNINFHPSTISTTGRIITSLLSPSVQTIQSTTLQHNSTPPSHLYSTITTKLTSTLLDSTSTSRLYHYNSTHLDFTRLHNLHHHNYTVLLQLNSPRLLDSTTSTITTTLHHYNSTHLDSTTTRLYNYNSTHLDSTPPPLDCTITTQLNSP